MLHFFNTSSKTQYEILKLLITILLTHGSCKIYINNWKIADGISLKHTASENQTCCNCCWNKKLSTLGMSAGENPFVYKISLRSVRDYLTKSSNLGLSAENLISCHIFFKLLTFFFVNRRIFSRILIEVLFVNFTLTEFSELPLLSQVTV